MGNPKDKSDEGLMRKPVMVYVDRRSPFATAAPHQVQQHSKGLLQAFEALALILASKWGPKRMAELLTQRHMAVSSSRH